MILYVIRFVSIILLTTVLYGMAKAINIEPMSLFTLVAFVLAVDLMTVRTVSILYFKGLAAMEEEKRKSSGND